MADKILQRVRHLTRFKGYFKGPKDQQIASVSSQGSPKNGPSGPDITPLEPIQAKPRDAGPYISAEDKFLANPTLRPRTQEDLCKYVEDAKWKNWATYGLDQQDRVRDEINFHNEIATFALFMLLMMYVCHYKKDPYKKDWARREATILVLEREEAGLPYIDMNYVDPKNLLENLATDEELEGTQVYI